MVAPYIYDIRHLRVNLQQLVASLTNTHATASSVIETTRDMTHELRGGYHVLL